MRNGEPMTAAVILLIVVGLGITFIVRRSAKSNLQTHASSPVRSFFQFGVLYALLVTVANGVAGLLGRLINPSSLVLANDSSLARNLSFVVVGLPLFIGIGLWVRKGIRANSGLLEEPLAGLFVLLGAMTSLLIALTSTSRSLQNLVSGEQMDGQALANAIVWTVVWGGLWKLHTVVIPQERSHLHHLAGSLVGFVAAVIGLISVIAQVLEQATGMNSDLLVSPGSTKILDALISFACGAVVWFHYWIRTARLEKQDNLWLAYVFIVGIGSGLVMAVVAASTVLYSSTVWFFGEPISQVARIHFSGTPGALGTVIVGTLSWNYHKSLIAETNQRSEINRVYEYIIAGISLIASSVGLSMILIAAIEASFTSDVIVARPAINSFFAAITLMIVGGPIWILFWRRIQRTVHINSAVELASPTRRIYLFLLFGIGGIAAIISLLAGVYQLFNDAFTSGISGSTIRDMRSSIGVLSSTAVVAVYHWSIYRAERDVEVAFVDRPRAVLLVGSGDLNGVRQIQSATSAQVTLWERSDVQMQEWPVEEVIAAINQNTNQQLIVVQDSSGISVIPVNT